LAQAVFGSELAQSLGISGACAPSSLGHCSRAMLARSHHAAACHAAHCDMENVSSTAASSAMHSPSVGPKCAPRGHDHRLHEKLLGHAWFDTCALAEVGEARAEQHSSPDSFAEACDADAAALRGVGGAAMVRSPGEAQWRAKAGDGGASEHLFGCIDLEPPSLLGDDSPAEAWVRFADDAYPAAAATLLQW